MTLRYLDVFAAAARIWRVDRPVLAAVAGVFFVLPQLASLLFLPVPDGSALTPEQAEQQMLLWIGANLHWMAAQLIVQAYGSAVILTRLLDPSYPTLGAAMGKALRSFPALLFAQAIMFGAITLGMMILFVPGFYLVGRLLLTAPTVIAEPERGPVRAVTTAFERAQGRGWWLLTPVMLMVLVSLFLGGSPHQLAQDALTVSPFLAFPLELLSAVLASGCTAGLVLIQAVLYRELGSARQGT